MNTEKQRAFIIHICYYTIIFTMIFIFFRYVIYFVMPFLIGFTISFMLRPLIKRLTHAFHGKEKVWSIVTILLFYLTIGLAITLLSIKGFGVLKDFFQNIPYLYTYYLEPMIDSTMTSIETMMKSQDPMMTTLITLLENISTSLSTLFTSISKGAVGMFTSFAGSLPNTVISFFFAIISSFFFASDYTKITGFISRQLPEKQRNVLFSIRHYLSDTVFKFIIAYGKIMTVTFIELSIGFQVLGIENAFVIAFLITIFDVLPVLGTGGIMIPWILLCFINGQPKLAIGLLILYLIVTIIRNIIEPRIVGKQIGLHPLLMLLCMYLGVKLFGFLGLFIMPFLILILQNLNKEGLIKLYR